MPLHHSVLRYVRVFPLCSFFLSLLRLFFRNDSTLSEVVRTRKRALTANNLFLFRRRRRRTGQANVGSISTRIQSLDVSVETKTLDNVFVNIIISAQYQVLQDKSRMFDAFYKLTDSKGKFGRIFLTWCGRRCQELSWTTFSRQREIAQEVKNMLAKSMEEFGYNIISTLVTDIAPDPKVKGAMNEINAAQRQRVAAKDRAEAEKIMVVKAAEADAESKYLAGTGMARQRQAIISGLRDSVVNFQKEVDGISSKDVMEMMMMTQYFDTMKEVGARRETRRSLCQADRVQWESGVRPFVPG